MPMRRLSLSVRHLQAAKPRLGVAVAWTMSAVVGLTLTVAVTANFPAVSRTADDDTQIARSLATMLRAGRIVISRNQDRINDPNVGA